MDILTPQMWIVWITSLVMAAMLGAAATLLVQKICRAAAKLWRWMGERRARAKANSRNKVATKAVVDEFAFDNMAFQPDPLSQSNLSRHRCLLYAFRARKESFPRLGEFSPNPLIRTSV